MKGANRKMKMILITFQKKKKKIGANGKMVHPKNGASS